MRHSPRPAALALASLSVLAASCAGETVAPAPRPTITLAAGDVSLRVDPGSGALTLLRGATTLLDFPIDALELGVVPAVDDAVNYDPYSLVVPSALKPDPDGLVFRKVTAATVSARSASAVELALAYEGGLHATLTVEAAAPGRFAARLTPGAGAPVAYFRLRPRVDAKEGFYGLGEHYDDVNQRGKIRAMQLEIDPDLESGDNEEHVPVPLLLGTQGWGLFVETAFPGVFAVATEAPDVVEATFGTGVKSGDGLVFHLFGAARPLDLTRLYYDVTGYPRLPARWALGPWVWRDDVADQAHAEADLQAMRDLDLAATGYWLDRPYATAVNSFDFNAAKYPDPPKFWERLRGLGFHGAVWHTPYLDVKAPSTAALRAVANAEGYYPKTVGILLNQWGKPIDFTNPAAYAWWQSELDGYKKLGVEGYKLDYGEDVVPGLTSARNAWAFADGSDERTMHARYQLAYHKVYADELPAGGGFLLCRHAMWGAQKNGPILWPGDLDSSFARQGDPGKDGKSEYTAVGGLPASLIAGLGLGPSGFPFYAADTGGYRHAPPDKELFTRWFEQTALSTVMQSGNAASTVPWEPDPKTGYDAEMLGWYRTYARLHLRLFPYEWTYAQNLARDGRAIERPVGLVYPELGAHPSDEYLFGDSLFVAPVLMRGATEREALFPPGTWIGWWDGKSYEGGQVQTVPAPLGTLPLFLAAGGIVPMLRPTIATLGPTTTPATVDSYATTPGVLWARVAPGEASSFTLFDGAVVTQALAGSTLALTSQDGAELAYGVMFEVIAAGKKPAGATDGGAALAEAASLDALQVAASGWFYAADTGGTVYVKVAAGAHQVAITL